MLVKLKSGALIRKESIEAIKKVGPNWEAVLASGHTFVIDEEDVQLLAE